MAVERKLLRRRINTSEGFEAILEPFLHKTGVSALLAV